MQKKQPGIFPMENLAKQSRSTHALNAINRFPVQISKIKENHHQRKLTNEFWKSQLQREKIFYYQYEKFLYIIILYYFLY